MKRLPDESRADETLVVSLWQHEMERIIKDRLCRNADCLWFDDTMAEILKEVTTFLPDVTSFTFYNFVSFSSSTCFYLMLSPSAHPCVYI